MAKDDSKVQVESLDQVIKLGQEIIVKESRKDNPVRRATSSEFVFNNSSNSHSPIGNHNNSQSKFSQRRNSTSSSNIMIEASAIKRATTNNNYSTPAKDGGLIRTNKSRVPGILPTTDKKNTTNKPFG